MAIITEVWFYHERMALADTLGALPDVDISIVPDARTDPEHDSFVIQFAGSDMGEIETVLGADRTVSGVEAMPGFEDQQLLGVEFEAGTLLLNPQVTSNDGFVIEAQGSDLDGKPRGWHERWLLPDGDALRGIWEHARENGFDFDVLELDQHGRADTDLQRADLVTDQQREALLKALEGGYFTEPREMSLEELARGLDLSSTAAAGRLRRGMKSLVGATLIVDGQER